ncbi:leucine zipper domain-containing protein [Vulcanococcus limneticus]|uniref:leucine zipper domain-containing protein n=1 Tax=Vulcanococcus limneticus TaxID=2170428 RepID=UPI00398BE390
MQGCSSFLFQAYDSAPSRSWPSTWRSLSLAELDTGNGISLRCSYRWLARYSSDGAASLADRCSVRRTQRQTHHLSDSQATPSPSRSR